MKNKFFFTILFLFILTIFIRPIGNLLLLGEGDGYIPNISNIFTFNLNSIEEGSGGYWRYGEDNKNYYFFSETEKYTYFYINKNNDCNEFDKLNIKTWCSAIKIKQK